MHHSHIMENQLKTKSNKWIARPAAVTCAGKTTKFQEGKPNSSSGGGSKVSYRLRDHDPKGTL